MNIKKKQRKKVRGQIHNGIKSNFIETMTTCIDLLCDFQKRTFISRSDLKRGYKSASFSLHPDKGGNGKDFQMLNNVYEVGLVWFKKTNRPFRYMASDHADGTGGAIVKGTPLNPEPEFMRKDFPTRWARHMVTSWEMVYPARPGTSDWVNLQQLVDCICQLRA
jgi:hypothetical protein